MHLKKRRSLIVMSVGIQKSKEKEEEKIKKELKQLKAIRKLSTKEITMLIREDRERWFSI